MNNSEKNRTGGATPDGGLSWIVVVVCFLIFWPLGLILLLKKVSAEGKRPTPPRPVSGGDTGHGPKPRQAAAGSGEYDQRPGAQATQPGGTAPPSREQAPTPQAARQVKDSRKNTGRGLSAVMVLLSILLGLIGVIFLSAGAADYAVSGPDASSLGMAIFGAFSLLGGILCMVARGAVRRRARRFNMYAAVIGSRQVVPVANLSRTVGEPAKIARRTLQAMLDCSYFGPSAYIDSELDSLVLSGDAAEKAHKARRAASAAADSRASAGSDNPYVSNINALHTLHSRTVDPIIREKIGRIEELTVKIFRIVEQKPEKLPQIGRFMNYYLPTTLKLLSSYETLEKQGIDGENITATKRDIERVLDTLVTGFEQQADSLFKSDKLDISSDIDVLERLMAQDGLVGGGSVFKAGSDS